MTKKVCMLVTNPVSNDPRVRREATTLVKAGYHMVVIGVKAEEEDSREEWVDGFRIIRIAHPRLVLLWLKRRSPNLYGALRKVYWLMKFSESEQVCEKISAQQPSRGCRTHFLTKLQDDCRTIFSMIWLNIALARAAWKERADIYHAHDLDTLLAGYLVTRPTGKKLVYDFHELYTEQFQDGVKTKLWHRYYTAIERLLVRRTDLRLTVCDSSGEWIAKRYGLDEVVTVKNVPEYHQYQESIQTGQRKGSEKIILYHGLYFRNRGLEEVIESVPHLKRGRVVFRGYGDLESKLRALVKEKEVEDRVSFAPPVLMTELVRTASEADIGVAPFLPVCLNTRFCLPNKLFEYMMAGLAVVGSDLPELRRVILGHQLGAVFNPHDPKDIARVINELLEDEARLEKMKQNARLAALTVYNWETEEQTLLKAYESLAPS